MSKAVKKMILVLPESSPCKDIEARFDDFPQMARFSGRLSYLVDNKCGLTPSQLVDVVKMIDTFIGLENA